MAAASPKIPAIKKFKGDNTQDFLLWIRQFECHCDALDVRPARRVSTLLCCLEATAFTIVSSWVVERDNLRYDDIKALLQERFGGRDYRRKLEAKLQGIKFKRGTNVNEFVSDLYVTIRRLYNLDGGIEEETVRSIAMNHITSNLDEDIRQEAKMFQLGGNESIEHLLEFLELKMSKNSLPLSETSSASSFGATFGRPKVTEQSRLDKLEQMMERVLSRLDDGGSKDGPAGPYCNLCQKSGHATARCFKKKTCNKCGVKGHIAKFCKPTTPANSCTEDNTTDVGPAQRTIFKLKIGA